MNETGKKAKRAAHILPRQSGDKIPSDTLGSYTGTPLDGEEPVQDADDL